MDIRGLFFGILCFVFLVPVRVPAQVKITLDSCIVRALESNYSIKIIRNQQQQAENNVSFSPFMPTLGVTAGQRQNIQDSKVIAGEEERKLNASVSDVLSAGVALNWRLFDGMEMFMTYSRYQEMLGIGELRT